MTLGIYGDSYGVKNLNSYKLWIDLVAERLNLSYTNYSKNASSLFYSYNQFLDTHKQHDMIIFLVTFPFRYTKAILLDVTGNKEHYISGIHNIECLSKKHKNLTDADKKLLSSLKNWFLLMDEDFYTTSQKFIVEDIITRRPDTIIMPCFYQSLTPEQYEKFGLLGYEHFYHLTNLQCQSLNLPMSQYHNYEENKEVINGHLTPELNNIVGDLVYNRIVNNKWNGFPLDPIEHEFTLKKYYKKIDV